MARVLLTFLNSADFVILSDGRETSLKKKPQFATFHMYFINTVQVNCEMDLFIGRTFSTDSPFQAVKIIFQFLSH